MISEVDIIGAAGPLRATGIAVIMGLPDRLFGRPEDDELLEEGR